jgi:Helix-turn-helix domain
MGIEQQHAGHDQGSNRRRQRSLDPIRAPGHHSGPQPGLTVTEAAQWCGVSASTIRRYLAAGRFPTAQQRPSSVPGQRGQWWIPTEDLLRAGLRGRQTRSPDQDQEETPRGARTADNDARERIRELELALEVERTRRQAAEDLAGERAQTIRTLESALRALEARRPFPDTGRIAAPAWPSSGDNPRPGSAGTPPGMLPMVPRSRRPRQELSQEERAAIIGRALSNERPPKRRWPWR